MNENISQIVSQYKSDKQSVYHTWFINNDERLKAFRAIRRGVKQVIDDIKNNSFGNDFKGSSLEFVLNSITEQKQVFTGAAHPFYWKPKLRIPDIYENENNKKAFAESYSMYDVLAKKIKIYGFIYPFIELFLGLAYLASFNPSFTNTATVIIMGFSSIGVIKSVMNKSKIQCACLGAVFNLPMSTITIIEDLLMVAMAAAALILN